MRKGGRRLEILEVMRGAREEILRGWLERVMGDPTIPHARRLKEIELLDHMPRLFDRIMDELSRLDEEPEKRAQLVGMEQHTVSYAILRMGGDYSISEVIQEYWHFRVMLLTVIYERAERDYEKELFIQGSVDASLRQVSEEMTRRKEELKERMIGIVSHDLRGPMGSVIFNIEASLRFGETDIRHREMLVRALRASHRAMKLAEELLDFSQLRAGGSLILRKKLCCFREIVRETLEENIYRRRRIQLEDGNCNLEGYWDCERLSQMASNLLANAVKYSLVESEIVIRLMGYEHEIEFTVENQGEILDKEIIFEAYRRGTRGSGAGLGLYIARHVVLAHGGTISAESHDGRVIFRVRLPRS